MLQQKNHANPTIKLLFYGSNELHPSEIYGNPKGWTTNFANDANPWGRGHLFSQSAAFCSNFAFKTDDNARILMLAEVIVGDSVYSEIRKYREPPEKAPGIRYDSIHCYLRDAWVWITYDSKRAYPRYIIEYSSRK